MDAKKRYELLNNMMSLLCRVEVKGVEAKPVSEVIDYAKELYDVAKAEFEASQIPAPEVSDAQ